MIELLIIAAYISLALELVLVPVPSVASARSLSVDARNSHGDSGVPNTTRLYLPVVLNILIFCIPLLEALAGLFDGAINKDTQWGFLAITGLGLLVSGRLLTVASALAMRRASNLRLLEGSIDVSLKTSGLFGRSRNPGLLGMYLFALGVLFLQPNAWFALGLIHYLWHMHRKIEIEERFLLEKYGDAYTSYLTQTRRYV